LSKAETYCYVIKNHLKRPRIRVCLYYSNQHPNPEKRIEIKRTVDLKQDLQTLMKLVQNELPGRKKVSLEKEKESIIYNTSETTIDKFFICAQ